MQIAFPVYLLFMAGVTYLVRMLPMVLIRNEIKNKFILAFLKYIPYAVLACMSVPAVFYATSSPITAAVGVAVAVAAAFKTKNLLIVASLSCVGVFIAEIVMTYVF